jgi:hypothetical protein
MAGKAAEEARGRSHSLIRAPALGPSSSMSSHHHREKLHFKHMCERNDDPEKCSNESSCPL